MANLTDFLGKKTVDISSCKQVGMVKYGAFNLRLKKLTHLVTDEGYVTNIKNVKITKNHILSTKADVLGEQNYKINLNTPLLTLDGETPKLKDVLLDNNMNVTDILTSEKTFTQKSVFNASDNLILLQGKTYKKPPANKKSNQKLTLIYPVEKKPLRINQPTVKKEIKDMTAKLPIKVTFTSVVPIKTLSTTSESNLIKL